MYRLGLMGCGTVASYGHLPIIKQSSEFQLAAIFEPDTSRTQSLNEQYQVAVHADVDAFFQEDFDTVIITSPAPFHYHNVVEAARHGKHVLCEKPLAMNEREAVEMIELMDRRGLMLFTAFDYRFSPVSQKIKEIVEQGLIGEVRSLRLHYVWNNHGKFVINNDSEPQPNLRRVGRMQEGGPMVDCGVHQIDLARWWLDSEVIRFDAHGAWVDEYEAPDHIYLHMKHENQAHTCVEISYSYGHTATEPTSIYTYDLIGTKGIVHYDRNAHIFEMRNDQGRTVLPYAKEKNFSGMYKALAEALKTGSSQQMPTGYDGLIATNIARTATDRLIAENRSTANYKGWNRSAAR